MGDNGVFFLAGFNFNGDVCFMVPGMSIEVAADHLAVFRPVVKGVSGGVDADEATSVFNESGEVGFEAVGDFIGFCFSCVV